MTGLWHGASWNFVLWGAYFGVLLIVEKFLLAKQLKRLPQALRHLYALFFIIIGWVIFDFVELSAMGAFFLRMFSLRNGLFSAHALFWTLSYLPLLLISLVACLPVGRNLWKKMKNTPAAPIMDGIGAMLIMLLSVASLVSSSYNPFLYFRF